MSPVNDCTAASTECNVSGSRLVRKGSMSSMSSMEDSNADSPTRAASWLKKKSGLRRSNSRQELTNLEQAVDRSLSATSLEKMDCCHVHATEAFDVHEHVVALEENWPRCVPEPVLIDTMAEVLADHGYNAASAINLVSTCRDEICRPFTEYLDKKWGTPSFNIASLAGMVFCGRTGFKAAMSHAPVVDGKERYVFWVAPHIAMSGTNEVGKVWRPGRDKSSTACGALLAVLGGINQRRLDMMLDPSDIEMSLIKQSVMSFLDYGNQPNLQELTYAVHECIVASVERTAEAAVDLAKSEYIIISGIQVHAGFSENFFWPGTMKKYTAEGVTDLYEEYASRMAEWRTTDEARSFFEDQELLMLQNTEGICRRAAQSGDLAALQQKASEINLEKVQDHSRRTLLHVAAAFGQVEVGNYLLSQCSTASFLHARDNLHLTAIDLAVLKQNYDFAQLLMDRGAGLEGEFLANGLIAAVEGGEIKHLEKLMWFAKDTSTAVHMSNKDGQSLVYIAAQLKDEATRMAMMEVLLSFGADIKQTDFYGNTPAVSEEMVTALKRAPSGEHKGAEEKGDE